MRNGKMKSGGESSGKKNKKAVTHATPIKSGWHGFFDISTKK